MRFDEIWELENFLLLDSVVKSQTFYAGRGVWRIQLFPLGNPMSKDKQRHVAVYLQVGLFLWSVGVEWWRYEGKKYFNKSFVYDFIAAFGRVVAKAYAKSRVSRVSSMYLLADVAWSTVVACFVHAFVQDSSTSFGPHLSGSTLFLASSFLTLKARKSGRRARSVFRKLIMEFCSCFGNYENYVVTL